MKKKKPLAEKLEETTAKRLFLQNLQKQKQKEREERLEQKAKKLNLQVERGSRIELLRSGYAALDSKGRIVDRREVSRVAKAFAEDALLGIPSPKTDG